LFELLGAFEARGEGAVGGFGVEGFVVLEGPGYGFLEDLDVGEVLEEAGLVFEGFLEGGDFELEVGEGFFEGGPVGGRDGVAFWGEGAAFFLLGVEGQCGDAEEDESKEEA
jgi:hypothetical protein